MFARDFESKLPKITKEIVEICSEYGDKLIDFRPYMILNPYTVNTTDTLEKCVNIFRNQHLRHLPVLHPGTGEIKGMITRKDLFRFMDL
jgi:CBS domain-containing protein